MTRQVNPLTLTDADRFVRTWHRDHRNHPPSSYHRFSLGLVDDDRLIGVIIVGFPIARATDRHQVAEVVRLAADGSPNACSQLLASAARVARYMGFARLQMFIEPTETGAVSFLRAAGFRLGGHSSGDPWNHASRKDGRTRRDSPRNPKQRWVIDFRPIETVTPGRRKCDACEGLLPLGVRPNRKTCSDACRARLARRRRREPGR